MSDHGDDRLKGSIKGDRARAERLAAELRRNLRRRKDRARATAAGESPTTDRRDQSDAHPDGACGEEARRANVAPIVAIPPICDSNTRDA